MPAGSKSKAQLLEEVAFLREKIARLESEKQPPAEKERVFFQSEECFRSIVEHSRGGLLIINNKFEIVYANNELCRLSGYSLNEMLGSQGSMIVAGEYKALVTERFHRRLAGEAVPTRYEIELELKGGGNCSVEVDAAFFDDPSGRRFCVAHCLDMTEQKRAQAVLLETQEKNQLLTDHYVTGVFISQDGQYQYINRKFAQILGHEAGEIIGTRFWEYAHPEDREELKQLDLAMTRGEPGLTSRYEYRIIRKNGRTAWLEMLTASMPLGGRLANIGNVVDITGRKQVQDALIRNEERYRLLFNTSPDAVVYHRDGKILLVNPTAVKILGAREPADLEGRDFYSLAGPGMAENMIKRRDAVVMRDEPAPLFESQIVSLDGQVIDIEVTGSAVGIEQSPTVQTVFRDITLRKRAEQELKKSEERFAAAFMASPQWLAISSKTDGRFVEVNEAFSNISGFKREEAIGRTASGLGFWPASAERSGFREKLHKQGRLRNYEVQWRLRGGLVHTLLCSVDPIEFAGQDCLITSAADITDLKKAEDDLRESEERYRSVMEAAYEPMVVYDLEGNAQFINPAFTRVFGWEPGELLGRRLDFVPQQEKAASSNGVETALHGGKVTNYETKRLTKDGRSLDVRISAAAFKDREGNVKGLVVNLSDITQRKRAEQALREKAVRQAEHDKLEEKVRERTAEMEQSRRNFEQAFQSSPAYLCIADKKTGRVVEVNQAYCRALGWRRDELIGKTTSEANIWPSPQDRERFAQAIRADAVSGMRFTLLRREGTPIIVTSEVTQIEYNGEDTFLFTSMDITRQVYAEDALKESELKYRTILDNTGNATAIIDAKRMIAYANSEFQRLSGYSQEELAGRKKWADFIHKDDRLMMEEYGKKRRRGAPWPPRSYEFRFVDRKGRVKNIINTVALIPGTSMTVISLLDITEQKLAQKELSRHRDRLEEMVSERTAELSKALSEKEVLLREIHHRVKNNMAVMASLLNLQASKASDQKVGEALQESQNRVRAMALIHETLYQSQSLAELELQPYIEGLVGNLAAIFGAAMGNISFRVTAGGIKLDVGQAVPCGLIINELVTNALKYAFPRGEKGKIHISAGRRDRQTVELAVADNGVGFPGGFDLQISGALGLRLISLMVEQLHGQWDIVRGQGAKIIINWPSSE